MVLGHIEATIDDLEDAGGLDNFEIFLLSDHTGQLPRRRGKCAPSRAFATASALPTVSTIARRSDNAGHKTGNLLEWLERRGGGFRLHDRARCRQPDERRCHPPAGAGEWIAIRYLGICQTLIAGLPSRVAFTRMFQFRHAPRHARLCARRGLVAGAGRTPIGGTTPPLSAIDAFMRHCRLPTLPGRGPALPGSLLSHDQLEAAQMVRGGLRCAGSARRVRQLRDQSALPAGIRAPLLPAWCQGNLNISSWCTKTRWAAHGAAAARDLAILHVSVRPRPGSSSLAGSFTAGVPGRQRRHAIA